MARRVILVVAFCICPKIFGSQQRPTNTIFSLYDCRLSGGSTEEGGNTQTLLVVIVNFLTFCTHRRSGYNTPPSRPLTPWPLGESFSIFYEGYCFEIRELFYFNCNLYYHRCMLAKLTCARASASSLLRFSASSCACSSSSWPRLA